ncbi:MAG: hypothetical protein IJT97_08425, partial [Bacteroidaceae bacterium]|nr:hypothetical protein [Bacteroidaceae bacterium]
KGIQIIGTSDSTFTLRWFNDRGNFNEHLFPSQTNIDEIYEQVKDSSDNIQKALNVLLMQQGTRKHRLQSAWKLRGWQKTNTVTSQYWTNRSEQEKYLIFGNKGTVTVIANARFPYANLQCHYTPCAYLSENVVDLKESTCIINWFDNETISMMTTDSEGHPFVTIWDRCGLPQNIQQVFGTHQPQMKKDISRFFSDGFEKKYGLQPDSIRLAFETFDFAVDANERNNAIFPILMRNGFEGEYTALKDSLMSRLMSGEISVDEAVSRYVFWFYKNFDRHTNCSSPFFWKLEKDVLVDYSKHIPQYAPEPVGCKVDNETYLLRLPSCGGIVPTWEWMEKKETEFKQSGCKYLILDLRGNSGGSDNYSLLFTRFMCDCSAMHDQQYFYLVSTENNRNLKMHYCDNDSDNYHNRVLAEATTAEEGCLINWITHPKGENGHTPLVRKGAIIIDNLTASAGESPVRYIRNYSKSHAKVYGRERTMGCEQTGNCNGIRLPNSNITLSYPMTVDDTFEKLCKERNPGYKPDIIVPLPYPEQLTDNIDSWVLWVANKMKR